MRKLATGLGLTLAAAIGAGAFGAPALYAQEKKEEYVPQAERETLVEKAVPGADGQVIHINRFTLPPGFVGGRHSHSGPVYVYVLEGTFTIDEEGKESQTFQAGEVYEEPVGTVMQARNMSADEPIKILVIQVAPEGEPLMYRAE